jgi:serine/threonine protein kinase
MTLVGKQLGKYHIVELLGEGAISYVYRAQPHNSSTGDVALKVIKPELSNHDEFIERFQREARISATLDHPNIIKVFDSGEIENVHYLSMQPLFGGSLAQRAKAHKPTLNTISSFLDQIASALDYAHSKQIVHRDLKPENVLFDQNNNAILADFGMVKPLTLDSITAKNTILGTPAYMSPEQCSLKPVDSRSDIYSLGVILFELLTGELPFDSNTPMAMMAMHVRYTPALVSSKRSRTSAELDAVINRALAKNPVDRFASAGEMAAEFKRVTIHSAPVEKQGAANLKHAMFPRVADAQVKATTVSKTTQTTDAANTTNAVSGRMVGMLIVIVAAVVLLTVAIVALLGSVSLAAN